MDSKVSGLGGTFIGKQDPMTAKRIYEKDSNTDLESSAVGHQNKESDGGPVTWSMYLEL